MTIRSVLITGGAGFLGSHLADELLRAGYRVRAFDVLDAHIHEARRRPAHLASDVPLVVGDVRDRAALESVLDGVDAVFHFAAAIGVGPSMYDVERYMSVNSLGMAALMKCLMKRPVRRLVVASSMSIYGEGLYRDLRGAAFESAPRSLDQLTRGVWEVHDPYGECACPLPTPETKSVSLESIYALSKYDQERIGLLLGRAYGIPTVALRFFNVYGPRQSISSPYSGVLATCASRLLNGERPRLFEDGAQRRDFVSVHDAVTASRLALESDAAPGMTFNVGSGTSRTIDEVARTMASVLGRSDLVPEVTKRYRVGDVRHCFADIALARRLLGYTPRVSFASGIAELAKWLEGQAARHRVGDGSSDREARGLAL
jgi:dTDP-L-rhamnose 4-epimerase